MDEKEAYDKVRRTTVLKKVAEKKGPTSTSEGVPKIQPRRLSDESKGTEKRKSKLKMFFPKTLIGWIHRRFGNLPNDIVFTIFAIYDSLQSETL